MKTKFGYMACPDCQARVVVKINEANGTLSYGCDECDGNGYCKKDAGRYPGWLKRITPVKPAPAAQPKSAKHEHQESKPAAPGSSGGIGEFFKS
jgi:hypothetical protein